MTLKEWWEIDVKMSKHYKPYTFSKRGFVEDLLIFAVIGFIIGFVWVRI